MARNSRLSSTGLANLGRLIRDGRTPNARIDSVQWRQATVTATPGGGVITITLGGSSTAITGVKYLSSYSPTVNDIVQVLMAGPDLIVLGKLV